MEIEIEMEMEMEMEAGGGAKALRERCGFALMRAARLLAQAAALVEAGARSVDAHSVRTRERIGGGRRGGGGGGGGANGGDKSGASPSM